MSILKRRILTVVFVLVFLVLAPMIVFYANGNILGDGWNVLATGGVYVRSMESGSQLFINGKLKDTTNFFTRDYFLKNLKPATYNVLVKKEGYNEWTNKVKVYANRVAETNVFMLQTDIKSLEIKEFLETEKTVGTTTKTILKLNPDYEMVKALFSTTSNKEKYLTVLSTTTGKKIQYVSGVKENPVTNRHTVIWKEGKDVYIGWTGSFDSSPKIFCEEEKGNMKCKDAFKVYSFENDVDDIDFFPGESEVIMVSVGSKIYAVEAEINLDKKPQVIYNGKKPNFQISSNNIIYIKDSGYFGQVEI